MVSKSSSAMPPPQAANPRPRPPKVFISYSHDSPQHRDRVLAVADRLRADGVDAQIDQYETSPPLGWARWTRERIVEADFILIVCTENYGRRFRGHESAGTGLGATWEGAILTQALYEAATWNTKLIPVVFASGDAVYVPLELRAVTCYHLQTPNGYESLYRQLTNQPRVPKPELGQLRPLPPREPRQGFLSPHASDYRTPQLDASACADQDSPPPNEHLRRLSESLEDASRRKEELASSGQDTAVVQEEILALRRALRQGTPLVAGDLLLGSRFRLIEPLGRGDYGTVWKAYDRQGERLVAIKFLHGQFAHDRSRRQRFLRGARKMRELQHHGVVQVIEEQLEANGHLFYVMEYVEGGDLRQAIKTGRLTVEQRLQIILKVGEALDFAHQRGMIHRDINPGNVLLDSRSLPKLTDFDLIRAPDTTGGTGSEEMLGAFIYTAPEALQNPIAADQAADQYSLAMMTIFALWGKDLSTDVVRGIETLVAKLSCPDAVKSTLLKAAAWDAKLRFSSIADFCHELSTAVFNGPRGVAGISASPGKPPPSRKRQWLFPAVSLFLTGIIALAISVAISVHRRESESSAAGLPATAPSNTVGSLLPQETGEELPLSATRPATIRERRHEKDGSILVYVPGGQYTLGSAAINENSMPVHRVRLSAFWINKYPVTREQYERYLATIPDHRKPSYWYDERFSEPQQPVVGVQWQDARSYCDWAGLVLPSEAQWEAAARGTDQRHYPWGDTEPTPEHANFGKQREKPTPVDAYPAGAGPYGTLDQAGNVSEWCLDVWNTDAYEHREGKQDPIGTTGDPAIRSLRGGSWLAPAWSLAAAYRTGSRGQVAGLNIGFRCLLPAGPKP